MCTFQLVSASLEADDEVDTTYICDIKLIQYGRICRYAPTEQDAIAICMRTFLIT